MGYAGYLLAICSLLFASLTAQDRSAPPQGIDWQADFDQALKQAKKEKRPIMVAFILKGEPSNEEICAEHFQDQRIIEASRKFVCLLAFSEHHSDDAGESTESSDDLLKSLAGRVSARQLRAIESRARTELLETNTVSTPQFLFLQPDGQSVLLRHVWMLPADELLYKQQLAYHCFDSSSPAPERVKAEVREVSDLLRRCDDKNMVKRREALRELCAKDHPDVVAFLIKQTRKSVDNQRRLEALRAMSARGAAKFLPTLHRLLRTETSFQIRSTLAATLRTIGLIESEPHLIKAIKREKKDNVRSLLLRALVACAPRSKQALKVFSKALKSSKHVDKLSVCYAIASQKPDPDLDKLVLKLVKSNKNRVRAGAYLVIGRHQLVGALKSLQSRVKGEKGIALKACRYALKQLGVPVTGAAEDPSSDISMLLPMAAW